MFQFLRGIAACLFSDGRGDYLPYSNNKFLWKKQQAGIKRNAEANQGSDLDQHIVPVSSMSSLVSSGAKGWNFTVRNSLKHFEPMVTYLHT